MKTVNLFSSSLKTFNINYIKDVFELDIRLVLNYQRHQSYIIYGDEIWQSRMSDSHESILVIVKDLINGSLYNRFGFRISQHVVVEGFKNTIAVPKMRRACLENG